MLALLLTFLSCVTGGAAELAPVASTGVLEAPASYVSEDLAADAWRRGDRVTAATLWRDALRDPEASALERARLCHNLGNAAFRDRDPLRAAAWYTASQRLDPRRADTYSNLELARLEADLDPVDDGSLVDTARRVVEVMGPSGTSWAALLGVLGLLVCLGGEALRGGFGWRAAAWSALLLQPVFWAPKVVHGWTRTDNAWMVVAPAGLSGTSEPDRASAQVAFFTAGEVLQWHDAVGEHALVSRPGERVAWVRAEDVFDLNR